MNQHHQPYLGGTEPMWPAGELNRQQWPPVDRWHQPDDLPAATPGRRRTIGLIIGVLLAILAMVLVGAVVIGVTLRQPAVEAAPPAPALRPPSTVLAPTVVLGQTVDFVDYDHGGLVRVEVYRWLSAEPVENRGDQLLAVHLNVEVTEGQGEASQISRVITGDGVRYQSELAYERAGLAPLSFEQLNAGERAQGWIFFELPKQDVTFLYQTASEEVLRLPIAGGPMIAQEFEITLGDQFSVEDIHGRCDVEVVGAQWVHESLIGGGSQLAVLLSMTANQSSCDPYLGSVVVADGDEVAALYGDVSQQHPMLLADNIYPSDTISGWRIFRVDRRPVDLQLGADTVQIPG